MLPESISIVARRSIREEPDLLTSPKAFPLTKLPIAPGKWKAQVYANMFA